MEDEKYDSKQNHIKGKLSINNSSVKYSLFEEIIPYR